MTELPATAAELTHTRMFCALHGEPFRAQWPKGAIVFQLEGLRNVLEQDALELGALIRGLTDEARARGIEALLDRKPMCCRLPRARLVALYTESGIGTRARCVHCRKKQLGTSLRSKDGGETFTIPHLCFECLAFRAYEGAS